MFCLCVSVFVPMYLCFPLSVSMCYGLCVCLFFVYFSTSVIFFDTARTVTWYNTLIKQLSMRSQKLLHSALPRDRAITQIITLSFASELRAITSVICTRL